MAKTKGPCVATKKIMSQQSFAEAKEFYVAAGFQSCVATKCFMSQPSRPGKKDSFVATKGFYIAIEFGQVRIFLS